MSSKGKHYSFYLQPHVDESLVPTAIRARNRDGNFYADPGTTELLVGTIGVAQVIKRTPKILDARKRAGLCNPDDVVTKQSEAGGYMDIGLTDGIPYQGNCVIVIKIPISKRDELKTMYFDFGINSVGVTDAVRSTVDAYYATNGTYNTLDMGLSVSDQTEARAYTEFIEECRVSAERSIRDICEKYAAYGSYIVILWK